MLTEIERDNEIIICDICKDVGICDFITRCGHSFHHKCINQWIFGQRCCPYCRQYVTTCAIGEKLLWNMKLLKYNYNQSAELESFFEAISGYRLSENHNYKGHKTPSTSNVPFYDKEVMQSLIQIGWDINSNVEGGLILLKRVAERDDVHRLEMLIECGMNLKNRYDFGTTALEVANSSRSILVARKIKSYASNAFDFTLHNACSQDNIINVKQLLDKGADVNARDAQGNRPLHFACSRSNLNVINLLIEKGAEINSCNLNGASPLYEACTSIFDRLPVVKRLLELSPDLSFVDIEKNTLIHISIIRRRFDVAEILVDQFTEVDKLNHFKESSLHLASDYAPASLIKKLVDKGADVNAKDSDDRTPLHRAVKSNTSEAVELLLSKGSDANALNNKKELPIFLAIQRSPALPFITALVSHGADLNLKDTQGKTALEIAYTNRA